MFDASDCNSFRIEDNGDNKTVTVWHDSCGTIFHTKKFVCELQDKLNKAEELICWVGACQDIGEIQDEVKKYLKDK